MVNSVVCLIINSNNEVLLLKRHEYDRTYPSIFCLPGGKLNKNETPSMGIVREVFEETGIFIYKFKEYITINDMCFYITNYEISNIKLSNEHSSYVITKNIDTLELGPITKRVLYTYYGKKQ